MVVHLLLHLDDFVFRLFETIDQRLGKDIFKHEVRAVGLTSFWQVLTEKSLEASHLVYLLVKVLNLKLIEQVATLLLKLGVLLPHEHVGVPHLMSHFQKLDISTFQKINICFHQNIALRVVRHIRQVFFRKNRLEVLFVRI